MISSAAAMNRSYSFQSSHCSRVTRQRVSGSFAASRAASSAPLVEVHPELQDHRAVVGQCALEVGHLVEPASNSPSQRGGDAIESGGEYQALRNNPMRPLAGRSRQ